MTIAAPRAFPPDPAAVRSARQYVAERLAGAGPGITEDALLLVSELASNSVLHAKSEFTVSVERLAGATVRIAVGDRDSGSPEVRTASVRDVSGRGIAIVAKLSDDWGVERVADGKIVWFTLTDDAIA